MAKSSPLLPLVRRFVETDPVAAARSLEMMDEREAVEVLKTLPPHLAADVFGHLPAEHAAELLKGASDDSEKFQKIGEGADMGGHLR